MCQALVAEDFPSRNSFPVLPVNAIVLQRRRVRRDWFQVVAGLGGGKALQMAVDAQHRHLKFIPFGGVAAHLFTQVLILELRCSDV
jgi:hypothetical protein